MIPDTLCAAGGLPSKKMAELAFLSSLILSLINELVGQFKSKMLFIKH